MPKVIVWQEVNLRVEDVFSDLPTLETKRLLLRKLSLQDTDDFFEYASDSRMAAHSPWATHTSREQTEKHITSIVEKYARHQVAPWGVVHKADGKLIGMAGFVEWVPGHARGEFLGIESRKYWGKGYAIEGLREIIAFGFRTMMLNRIEGMCQADNAAAAFVMERAGMKLDGTLREHRFDHGAYHDIKVYSILRSEVPGL